MDNSRLFLLVSVKETKCSIFMVHIVDSGGGSSISYWQDTCQGAPRIQQIEVTPTHERILLKDACGLMSQIDLDAESLDSSILTSSPDTMLWQWENSGIYSAKSVYAVLTSGGLIARQF